MLVDEELESDGQMEVENGEIEDEGGATPGSDGLEHEVQTLSAFTD